MAVGIFDFQFHSNCKIYFHVFLSLEVHPNTFKRRHEPFFNTQTFNRAETMRPMLVTKIINAVEPFFVINLKPNF